MAWSLVSFAIGALAGVLIRRVIPAMFATVGAWGSLASVGGLIFRAHYRTPLVSSGPNAGHPGWVISQSWMQGGKPVSLDAINQALAPVDIRAVTPELFSPGPSTPPNLDPVHYLIQHGYVHLTSYVPDSWFWPFQWIETSWLVAFSMLLLAVTVWLVRRRAA